MSMCSVKTIILTLSFFIVSNIASAEIARPAFIKDKSRPYSEYVSVVAHNAYNFGISVANQQKLSIRNQLSRGVRGFMLDLWMKGGEIYTCHRFCNPLVSTVTNFKDNMSAISDFLKENPDDVVSIHIEIHPASTVSRDELSQFFVNNPQYFASMFDIGSPAWSEHQNWPTLAEMIAQDQRLLLMIDQEEMSGAYGPISVIFDEDILVQNTYSIGGTIAVHDFSCTSRWSSVPLDMENTSRGWKRLFLMNHFHSVGERLHAESDNRWDTIENRIHDECAPAANREPNFIAVDHIDQGDLLEYVEMRNNGGVVAYEEGRAREDVVCGFSTAIKRNWSMQDAERLGCENDEMRSLLIRGAKAGQRLTLYDAPSGHRDDDFAILDIKRDIPWSDPQTVDSFEATQANPSYEVFYSGGNGLNGKVSRIKVEPDPTPFSASVVVLLNNYNGEGRISCSFGLTSSRFWNIKDEENCYNDDAKSLNLFEVKAGTVITVYDSPSGSTSDDYTTIEVHQDILKPVTIANLEANHTSQAYSVKFYRHNGLNGKVSSVRVSVP